MSRAVFPAVGIRTKRYRRTSRTAPRQHSRLESSAGPKFLHCIGSHTEFGQNLLGVRAKKRWRHPKLLWSATQLHRKSDRANLSLARVIDLHDDIAMARMIVVKRLSIVVDRASRYPDTEHLLDPMFGRPRG
jgi:hypothetical protein